MFNQKSKGVTTMGRLADKNILITGGNSGIGLAAAQEFDREGARVAMTSACPTIRIPRRCLSSSANQ